MGDIAQTADRFDSPCAAKEVHMATGSELGARVRRLRTDRGLTQRELAEPRYTAAFVSCVESGSRKPSQEALDHFARRLEVDPDELLTGRPAHLAAQLDLHLTEARRLRAHGEVSRAEQIATDVEKEAGSHDLLPTQYRAHLELARCAAHRGETTIASEWYAGAERLMLHEPLTSRIEALAGRAHCHRLVGEVRYAVALLESALDELQRRGLVDPSALMTLNFALTRPYFELGAHTKAARAAETALGFAAMVSDPELVARMHMEVARVYIGGHRITEAEASLAKAHVLYDQLDLRADVGGCHLVRGYYLAREGDFDAAERELVAAIDVLRSTASLINLAHAINELAAVYRQVGRLADAHRLLDESLALLVEESDVAEVAFIHRERAQVFEGEGDLVQAEKEFGLSSELYRRSEARSEYAATCRLFGDLLSAAGRAVEAASVYRDGLLAVEGVG